MRASGGANVSLTIESDPPGADAKTSLGASCRTPCMIPVAADREFTVSYALNGYLPQVVPVRRECPNGQVRARSRGGGAVRRPDLTPNPVYAQLEPAPPPAADARRAADARQKQTTKSRQQ